MVQLKCIHAGKNGWLEDGRIYTVKEEIKVSKLSEIDEGVLIELKEIPGILWGPWRFERVPPCPDPALTL